MQKNKKIFFILLAIFLATFYGCGSSSNGSDDSPNNPEVFFVKDPGPATVKASNLDYSIIFNKTVDLNTVKSCVSGSLADNTGTIKIQESGGSEKYVNYIPKFGVNTSTLVLDLSGSNLSSGSYYNVNITNGVKSTQGNLLCQPSNFSFQYQSGSLVLNTFQLIKTVPSNGATKVSSGAIIHLNFDDSISGATVSGGILFARSGAGQVEYNYIISGGNEVIITPKNLLYNETSYSVNVNKNLQSTDNKVCESSGFDFTTISGANPGPKPSNKLKFISSVPASGASNIALDSKITLHFNEPINKALGSNWVSINNNAKLINQHASGDDIVCQLSGSSNKTLYNVIAKGGSGGVLSTSGDYMADLSSGFSFTTTSGAPPIKTYLKFNGATQTSGVAIDGTGQILMHFNEKLPSTVKSSCFSIDKGATFSSITASGTNDVLGILSSGATASSTYHVTITGGQNGIVSTSGDLMSESSGFDFTTSGVPVPVDFKHAGYLEMWGTPGQGPTLKTAAEHGYNIIILAFACYNYTDTAGDKVEWRDMNGGGILNPSNSHVPTKQMIEDVKTSHPKLKVLISFGGATNTFFPGTHSSQEIANAMVAFAKSIDADGIDFDFERDPYGTPGSGTTKFNEDSAFIDNLAKNIVSGGLIVGCAPQVSYDPQLPDQKYYFVTTGHTRLYDLAIQNGDFNYIFAQCYNNPANAITINGTSEKDVEFVYKFMKVINDDKLVPFPTKVCLGEPGSNTQTAGSDDTIWHNEKYTSNFPGMLDQLKIQYDNCKGFSQYGGQMVWSIDEDALNNPAGNWAFADKIFK